MVVILSKNYQKKLKSFLAFVLTFAMLACNFMYSGTVQAEASSQYLETALKPACQMTVDGKLDESAWGMTANIETALLGSGSSKFGTLWNDDYLFVGVQVVDESVIDGDSTYAWDDDSVEIYIDGDNVKGNYNSHTCQLILKYNDPNIYQGGSSNIDISGVLQKSVKTATGYSVEAAIPWSAIGGNPVEGKTIGFNIHINDDDNGNGVDNILIWTGGNSDWATSANWGEVVLSSQTAGQTTPVENPNLISNGGFENGTNLPDGWIYYSSYGGTVQIDSNNPYEGQNSIKLSSDSTSKRAILGQSNIILPEQGLYRLSAYYHTNGIVEQKGSAFIVINRYDSANTLVGGQVVGYCEKDKSEWTKLDFDVPCEENVHHVLIQLHLLNSAGSVWFDDIQLYKVEYNPQITPSSATYNKADDSRGDICADLTLDGLSISSITNGEYTLEAGNDYTVSGEMLTIKMDYLESLPEGTTSLTVNLSYGQQLGFSIEVINQILGPDNLISNGGFENGTNLPDGWIYYSSYGGIVEFDSNNPYKGQKSIKLSCDSTSKRAILGQSNIIVPQEGIYQFSAYYRTDSITGEAPFIIYYKYDSAGKLIGKSVLVYCEKNKQDWTKLFFEIPCEESVHHLMFQLYLRQTTGSVWFDDIQLNKAEFHPEIIPSSATYNKADASRGDLCAVVTLDSLYIESITNGEYTLEAGNDYTVSDQMLTVKKDYLESLPEGTTSLILNLNSKQKLEFSLEVINQLMESDSIISNGGFEYGSALPYSWSFNSGESEGTMEWDENEKYEGNKAVKLNTGNDEECILNQGNITVSEGKSYLAKVWYKNENATQTVTSLIINWYDTTGKLLGKDKVDGQSLTEWTELSMTKYAPDRARIAVLQLALSQGQGSVWMDNVEFNQILVDANGNIIPVTDVEDINEPMSPADFWGKIPECDLNIPVDSLWANEAIREFFFGPTVGIEQNFAITIPEIISQRDENIPVLEGKLGQPVDSDNPLIIAGDIEHRPFMKGHGSYSTKYYPRRMHDYVAQEYIPSYVLTGDEKFKNRAQELLNFLKISQWDKNGENQFTSEYYPDEYEQHSEWAGGWDYLFDWEWKDAYGYTWGLHEPDHHVNSQITSTLVSGYQIFGDPEYLEMAREFVYHQIPRYGFHKGVWNNKVYYWSEYNPTGSSLKNPYTDATDNINALVALACAMVGHYETDPVLRSKYLEYARGLLWYMVREITTDGRFFYDGAENPLNYRKAISHDTVCVVNGYVALSYLSKSGVEVDDLMNEFLKMEENYRKTWSVYQKKYYFRMFKLYDGVPAPNEELTFSTFAYVISEDIENAKFKDTISDGFVRPKKLKLRISKLLNPDSTNGNWRTDLDNDVVLTVTPEQLEEGVVIPFKLEKGYTYKMSYDLMAKSDFERENAIDYDSEIFGWKLNEDNDAVFIRGTTGSVGDGINTYTVPLRMQTNINSTNFLSYGARIVFPFEEEISACLEESKAPAPTGYIQDNNWGNITANRYIYLTQSLTPLESCSGEGLICDGYGNKGKLYLANEQNDFVEFKFDTYLPEQTYKVYTNYATANNRGIAQVYIDEQQQGEPYDLYVNSLYPITQCVDQGTKMLNKGTHTLKFVSTGKNPSSSGYAIGVYDAIILEPLNSNIIGNAKEDLENALKEDNKNKEKKENVLTIIEKAIKQAAIVTVNPEDVVVEGSKAVLEVDSDALAKAIENAASIAEELEQMAKDAGVNVKAQRVVTVEVPVVEGTTEVAAKLSISMLDKAKESGIDRIAVRTGIGTIAFEPDAIRHSVVKDAEMVEFSMAQMDKGDLPAKVAEKVGDNPVYDFNAYVDGEKVSKFTGKNEVQITIPYTLKDGENPDKIVVYYINDNGELEAVKNGKYNKETGMVTFTTNRFR